MFKNRDIFGRVMLDADDGAGAGGAGGAGGGVNMEDPAVQAAIKAVVEKETAGLKKNNADLLNEKRGLKTEFDKFKGLLDSVGGEEGIKRVALHVQELNKTEDGKLLAEGKYEEWHGKKVEGLIQKHKTDGDNWNKEKKTLEDRAVLAEAKYSGLVLRNDVMGACKDGGVEPSAYEDVQLRAEKIFTYDDKLQRYVIKDPVDGTVINGPDGNTPKTMKEWLEEQKKISRHWFPASAGSGAQGSGFSGSGKEDWQGSTDFSLVQKNLRKAESERLARR